MWVPVSSTGKVFDDWIRDDVISWNSISKKKNRFIILIQFWPVHTHIFYNCVGIYNWVALFCLFFLPTGWDILQVAKVDGDTERTKAVYY